MNYNDRFEEIYKKISENNYYDIEKKRKETRLSANIQIFLDIILSLNFGIFPVLLFSGILSELTGHMSLIICFFFFLVIILVFVNHKIYKLKTKQYEECYMTKFNKDFIYVINPSFQYDGTRGVLEKSSYYSENRGVILGMLKEKFSFKAGHLINRTDSKDSDGNSYTYISFNGLYYEIKLPFNVESKTKSSLSILVSTQLCKQFILSVRPYTIAVTTSH